MFPFKTYRKRVEDGMLPRYYIQTRYHVWSIIDRKTDSVIEHIGARGHGDVAARKLARETCEALNEKELSNE